MRGLTSRLAEVKTRDDFHTVVNDWCAAHAFSYSQELPLHKNIAAARRQCKFIVATSLHEASKIYDRL